MDISSYLVVQTPFHMFVMNLKEFGTQYEIWNSFNPDDLKPPPLAASLDFSEQSLPIGMGSFKLGSALCMIGGEKVKKDLHKLPNVRNPWVLDTFEDDRNQGTSRDVFICKLLSSGKLLLQPTDIIPKLEAGKARPIVELIGGKIFVHHSLGVFHEGWDNPDPVFEVYIPSENSEKNYLLQTIDVPFVTKSHGLVKVPPLLGFGHFVIGSKLFIPADLHGLHCFNAAIMEWDDDSRSNLLCSFNEVGLAPPFFGRCVSGLGSEGPGHVMVCLQGFGCFICPRPYGYLIDETGRLLYYQDLSEQLFNDFLPYVATTVDSHFLDLGSGYMCAILYVQDAPKIDVVLHICFFTIQRSPEHVNDILVNLPSSPMNKEFLVTKTDKKYFCKLNGVGCYSLSGLYSPTGLVNAFFLDKVVAGTDEATKFILSQEEQLLEQTTARAPLISEREELMLARVKKLEEKLKQLEEWWKQQEDQMKQHEDRMKQWWKQQDERWNQREEQMNEQKDKRKQPTSAAAGRKDKVAKLTVR